MKNNRPANRLIHESSPYLLQHAHNPVDWHPWNEETLDKAKKLDKMILVSIGYSACHWCHVMEHESFEDEEVAKVMNDNFVCVKVDREERPDVDQVYMDAVQLISGRGGWPLNCFAMPDGRPVWGGTYFQRSQWLEILDNIALLFTASRDRLEKQAGELYAGIQENHFISPDPGDGHAPDRELAGAMAGVLAGRIDHVHGGFRGAPKFPMPNNFLFLLRFSWHAGDGDLQAAVEHTLERMAAGGIYDQLGGGFARYSVDDRWHVPHFEKMLYDNAQLVSLYAEAYRLKANPWFEAVIRDTLAFVGRELTSPEGAFYSALDADSEGAEGKFYVWGRGEFDRVLGEDAPLLASWCGMDEEALWEDGVNVLVRPRSLQELATEFNLPVEAVEKAISRGRHKLFTARSMRIRPGLDDKVLASWNALMLKGYVDAYRALGDAGYLEAALRNAVFLRDRMIGTDGFVMRAYREDRVHTKGFLDDHAFMAEAFIALYEVTLDEQWVLLARKLAGHTLTHFYDGDAGMFGFTSSSHTDSLMRRADVTDNVIPSASSSMARVLYVLSLFFEEGSWTAIADTMFRKVADSMRRYPSVFTNWGIYCLQRAHPFHTMVVTGPEADLLIGELKTPYMPNVLLAGGTSRPQIPIAGHRWDGETSRIHVCTGSECMLPVELPAEAIRSVLEGK